MAISLLLLLLSADPISPSALYDALQVVPKDDQAKELADRLRATFPMIDLKKGATLVEVETVAFVVESPSDGPKPRLGGMLNHSQGYEMVAIGETGLWAFADRFPGDTKFAYEFNIAGKAVGKGVIEMPAWAYPTESKPRDGITYSDYRPIAFRSKVFENDRKGWIYVPLACEANKTPAAIMVFQDGSAYKGEHVGTVVENLIADKAMPPTILVLLDPGVNDDGKSNRSVEYDTLGGRYATFLETEVFPLIRKVHAIRDEPSFHAIGGASSGGICAFNAAWNRPDLFGRVCSQIGSFTNIRGGHVYPELVRSEARKPIKILLSDGTNDLINRYGDWWQANEAMDAALREKGYDVTFLRDRGFHAYWSCGRVLPEALRKTWSGWSF